MVEPSRGDTYAPGLASTGLVDTAEWVAMGLHRALLDRATKAGRVSPGQSGPGYLVLEFALCSDGRWHKVDPYGRKLALTAELLDEEALLEALERAAEEESATLLAAEREADEEKEVRGVRSIPFSFFFFVHRIGRSALGPSPRRTRG